MMLLRSALPAVALGAPMFQEPGRVPERGLYWDVQPYDSSKDPSAVSEVHVAFSNHLDVGFNSRAWCMGGAYQGCVNASMSKDGMECRPWAYSVIQANIETFIPRAIDQAERMRNTDTPFTYMTQPFVVDFLLDCEASGLADWRPGHLGEPLLSCPNASSIEAFKAAVTRGDIWWQAFPHNAMPGLYDASLFNASVQMGMRQADALGVRRPTTFSQRDETGMTRAIIPLLAANGVGMISLGSGGSGGGHPVIPDLFVWKDKASDKQVLFAFDHGYGGGTHVLPNGHALYCAWNTDNGGPMTEEDVKSVYEKLRKHFPNAKVHASTFDAFYDAALEPGVMEKLPVVTQDIGDTWNYGVPSDPLKNVHFRVMSRLRRACIESGRCDASGVTMQRFDRLLTKIPEHTWGEDNTWYLGDNTNWTNAQNKAVMGQGNYQMTVASWTEQRSYLENALRVLERAGQDYAKLASDIRAELGGIEPARPAADTLAKAGFVKAGDPQDVFSCKGVQLAFGADGGLARLERDGSNWASSDASLGKFTYQTLDDKDFKAFDDDYGNGDCTAYSTDPGCHNFNKPLMIYARPQHLEVSPVLAEVWYRPSRARGSSDGVEACEFQVKSMIPSETPLEGALPCAGDFGTAKGAAVCCGQPGTLDDPTYVCPSYAPVCKGYVKDQSWGACQGEAVSVHDYYGAPDTVWTGVSVLAALESATVNFDVQVFNKTRTRLAEASWVSFKPVISDAGHGWLLQGFHMGLGEDVTVDPTSVVTHGGVHLHTLGPYGFAQYTGPEGTLTLSSLDVPILSAGLMTPFPTPGDNSSLPENMKGGMHFNLHNNIWNVNFPLWYPFLEEDKDARYRFAVTVTARAPAPEYV